MSQDDEIRRLLERTMTAVSASAKAFTQIDRWMKAHRWIAAVLIVWMIYHTFVVH